MEGRREGHPRARAGRTGVRKMGRKHRLQGLVTPRYEQRDQAGAINQAAWKMPDQRYDVSAKTVWNRNSLGSKREDGRKEGGRGRRGQGGGGRQVGRNVKEGEREGKAHARQREDGIEVASGRSARGFPMVSACEFYLSFPLFLSLSFFSPSLTALRQTLIVYVMCTHSRTYT